MLTSSGKYFNESIYSVRINKVLSTSSIGQLWWNVHACDGRGGELGLGLLLDDVFWVVVPRQLAFIE